jgi:hypothetical protein
MIGYSVPQNRSPRSALNELVPQGRAGRGAAGVAQKPGQDSPDRREAGGGPIRAETRQRLSEALCRAFGGQASGILSFQQSITYAVDLSLGR